MTQPQALDHATALYGNVQLTKTRQPEDYGNGTRHVALSYWCLIHVWDHAAGTYVLRGFGHTWEDAFIDAARYETAEIAYA